MAEAVFERNLTDDDVVNNLTRDATKVPSAECVYDAIQAPLTWANGTKPTLSNGTHYGDGCYYWKRGGFVYLHISVEFNSPPSNALLFQLPEGCRPIGNAEITVSGGGSYNAKAQCNINSSGNVRVTSVDKWVTGSGLFLYST